MWIGSQAENQGSDYSLFSVLIRPHLEYCILFWSPQYNTDIDKLEEVQGRPSKRWWAGAPALSGEAVGPRLVQPAAETALRTPNSRPQYLWGANQVCIESGSSQQCMVGHRKSSHKWKWEVLTRYKEKNSLRITEHWGLPHREAEGSLSLQTRFDPH